jgi:predicted membrane-bound spermidine synthase
MKGWRMRIITTRKYEAVAFITGFALMVFELVASRILAPTIGSSTYVWTSVIGVIIAALSIGYAVGGWLADKRVAKHDISWLLLAASACVVFALLVSSALLDSLGQATMDARFKGLYASLVLFMPASFVLGVISPYLVRLHTDSIAVAGRSVASLSALNAVGGIIGTFSAGFVFFSIMGSRQTLVLVAVLLLASSWLIAPAYQWKTRALLSAAIVLFCLNSLAARASGNTLADIDTPSAHYKVVNTTYGGQELNALVTGPRGWQSGVFVNQPNELAFDYTRGIAEVVAEAPRKDHILVLGGGAFTLPQHFGQQYPKAQVDAVEIDPKLVAISEKYFQYRAPANVRIIADDARAFLGYSNATYDVIVIDVYSDINVPFAVATTEYTAALKSRLKPGGVVVANIIGANTERCAPLLGSLHSSYMNNFRNYRAFPTQDPSLSSSQNIIVAYSNDSLAWTGARQSAKLPTGQLLTDDYAPIERLGYPCWQS